MFGVGKKNGNKCIDFSFRYEVCWLYEVLRIHNNKSLFYGQTILKLVQYKRVLLNSLQFNYK
jgi:hypothetical protein